MLKFADETEERYFRTFLNETVAGLEGWVESSFWKRLILQAWVEKPFTQKVVTALAAMSNSKKILYIIEIDTAHRAIVAQLTEFAYKQYRKALQGMRNALKKDGHSRKAVVGCILLCCFESLVRKTASAHQHVMACCLFMRSELLGSFHDSPSLVSKEPRCGRTSHSLHAAQSYTILI
jgi:hypothetical protein